MLAYRICSPRVPFFRFRMCWTWFFPCFAPDGFRCCNSKQVVQRRRKKITFLSVLLAFTVFVNIIFSKTWWNIFCYPFWLCYRPFYLFMTFLPFFSFVHFVLFRLIFFIGDGFFLRFSRLSSFIDCLFAVIFTIAQTLCDGFKWVWEKK